MGAGHGAGHPRPAPCWPLSRHQWQGLLERHSPSPLPREQVGFQKDERHLTQHLMTGRPDPGPGAPRRPGQEGPLQVLALPSSLVFSLTGFIHRP